MFNTTKALLALIIVMIFLSVVLATWVFTPPHSGVAMAIGMLLLPFAAVFIAWVYDTPYHI